MKICAIILSAGNSKRFKSTIAKFKHNLAGQPIIDYNINVVQKIKKINKYKIISSEENSKYFQDRGYVPFKQNPIDGTGGAVNQFYKKNNNYDYYLVMLSDTPVFDYKIINNFLNKSMNLNSDISVLSQKVSNPKGYGRIILKNNKLIKIIEEKDCDKEQKKINLINTGIFLISKKAITNLNLIKKNPTKKEYYITDIIDICNNKNLNLITYENKELSIMGVNNLNELNNLETLFQKYIKDKLMSSGVRIYQPETVYIENDVDIEKGVCIEPNVVIRSGVKIKRDTIVKSFSYLENCKIGKNCSIGPFARIRPSSDLQDQVKIGNFVEIKKSKLSSKVKVNHLSYIGDSQVGKNTNIGAGTITCNYDGKNKLSCFIGDNCFIGSNSSIVAPVNIGNKVYVAAGSVITKNISKDHFSISRAKQRNIKNIKK
tara:strand:+ start:465 stop:1754 length:1290 start_codon:yes stop_codon:yes gene_type:complete